ncbi:prepilin-type N-terminal cleavage/methylation domain-containing protein [Candidatus Gracilibacteria bacterium 28_42_T64]|nr:prepilin-type N-terminal cleavage/methylation domain-containing protein [Candidatus Gracilibacteria bacterium 28_42_T64]
MNMKKQAFTIIELIVAITIMAIISIIAFISLQGYSKNARDSVRQSDIAQITSVMGLYEKQVGRFPKPTEGVDITYSGAQVWNQGTIGDSVILNLGDFNQKPVDPLTGSEYTYSRLNTKSEYEVAAVMEGGISQNILTGNTYAEGNITGYTYIRGNYNKILAKVNTGSITYVLGVPTIISGDITLRDIISLMQSSSLVYNGSSNLPASYIGTRFNSSGNGGGFTFNPGNIVAYTGTTESLSDIDNQVTLFNNLQTIYTATDVVNNNGIITKIVDADDGTVEEKILASIIVKQHINSGIELYTDTGPVYFVSSITTNASGKSYGESIIYDSSGYIYITGLYKGDVTIGTDTYSSAGNYDIFLAKFDSSGNYIWSQSAGGTGKDVPYMLNIDSSDNLYLIGRFSDGSPDIFGTTFTNSGDYDIFLTKFDSDGNVLINKKGGGTGNDRPKGIVIGNDGSVYITGQYDGTADIFGMSISSPDANPDSFVVKLDNTLTSTWVQNANSIGIDWGNTIAIEDITGDLYIAGSFSDNMTLYGAAITTYGQGDSYLLKMNNSGVLQWINTSGGVGYEESEHVIIDNNGDIFFTGWFRGISATLFGEVVSSPDNGSRNDTYVSKLTSNGVLVWNSIGKGPGNDYGQKLALDNDGNIYSVGSVGLGENSLFGKTVTTSVDGVTYVSKLDSNGNALWSKLYGEHKIRDDYSDIKFDGTSLYLVGGYEGTSTVAGQSLTAIGSNEAFFGKINADGNIE